jgi:hypothetical protein
LFKKLEAMPATPHLEKFLQYYLEEAKELPTDGTLVQLVRLQNSAQNIAEVLPAEKSRLFGT